MCRIAAFPPMFPRNEALEILANFEDKNTDGTGSAFVRDGKFVVDKWAKAFSVVVKNKPFLAHMPYNGWTIAHLRAGSHGANLKENTHPFVVGPWAFIHNGVWSEHNIVRLALSKQVQMEGETDSEVAAHFWNIIGPKKFSEAIDFGGVFMGLHRSGALWVVKTSGDLEVKAQKKDERVLLASEFDRTVYGGCVEALHGWYQFDNQGKYVKHKENKQSWSRGYPYGAAAYVGGGFTSIGKKDEDNGVGTGKHGFGGGNMMQGGSGIAGLSDRDYRASDFAHNERAFTRHCWDGD